MVIFLLGIEYLVCFCPPSCLDRMSDIKGLESKSLST